MPQVWIEKIMFHCVQASKFLFWSWHCSSTSLCKLHAPSPCYVYLAWAVCAWQVFLSEGVILWQCHSATKGPGIRNTASLLVLCTLVHTTIYILKDSVDPFMGNRSHSPADLLWVYWYNRTWRVSSNSFMLIVIQVVHWSITIAHNIFQNT